MTLGLGLRPGLRLHSGAHKVVEFVRRCRLAFVVLAFVGLALLIIHIVESADGKPADGSLTDTDRMDTDDGDDGDEGWHTFRVVDSKEDTKSTIEFRVLENDRLLRVSERLITRIEELEPVLATLDSQPEPKKDRDNKAPTPEPRNRESTESAGKTETKTETETKTKTKTKTETKTAAEVDAKAEGELERLKRANSAMRSEIQQMQQRLASAGIAIVDPSQYSLPELEEEIDRIAATLREDPDDEDASSRLTNFLEARDSHPDFIRQKQEERDAWRAKHAEAMREAFGALATKWGEWPADKKPRKRASFRVLRLIELFDSHRKADSEETAREAVSKLHPADFRQFSTRNLSRADLLAVFFTLPEGPFATDQADVKASFREGVYQALLKTENEQGDDNDVDADADKNKAPGILGGARRAPLPAQAKALPRLGAIKGGLMSELAQKLKLKAKQSPN